MEGVRRWGCQWKAVMHANNISRCASCNNCMLLHHTSTNKHVADVLAQKGYRPNLPCTSHGQPMHRKWECRSRVVRMSSPVLRCFR